MLSKTQRKIVIDPTNFQKSRIRQEYSRIRKKVPKALDDLILLSQKLPEKQLEQIFSPEKVTKLFKVLVEFPDSSIKKDDISQIIKKEKLNELATYLVRNRLPKSWGYGQRRGPWLSDPTHLHPSFKRQHNIIVKILKIIYDTLLQKIDPIRPQKGSIGIYSKILLIKQQNQKYPVIIINEEKKGLQLMTFPHLFKMLARMPFHI